MKILDIKTISHLFLITLNLLCWTAPSYAATIQTKAAQAIMIDFETGMVLFEKNADKKMPTSSMSKVMTMYMVFEALKKPVRSPGMVNILDMDDNTIRFGKSI